MYKEEFGIEEAAWCERRCGWSGEVDFGSLDS